MLFYLDFVRASLVKFFHLWFFTYLDAFALRIASLREQLISMHIYLDDVLDRLEWRHYVLTRLKKELGMAGWVLLGIITGIASCLPHMTAH